MALKADQEEASPLPATVVSSLKIYDMFNYCIETLICALNASAVYIYLYDNEHERLVLAQMNAFYPHISNPPRQALAEGIAGMVALTKEAVYSVHDLKLEQYYPIHELKHAPESVIALPILDKQKQLLGVVSAHSEHPDAFTTDHHRYLAKTASILANHLAGTDIYQQTERIHYKQDRQDWLNILGELAKISNSNLPLDEFLKALSKQAQQMLAVDLCLILLANQQGGPFTVRASSQALEGTESYVHPIKIQPELWTQISRFFETEELPKLLPHELEALNPLEKVPYVTLLPIPLTREGELPGLLLCYTSRQRDYAPDDQIIFKIIANQLNLALKHQRTSLALERRQLSKTFLNDLLAANAAQVETLEALTRRASFFDYDLSQAHRLLLIEFSQTHTSQPGRQHNKVIELMESELLQRYPSVLQAEDENLLRALIPELPTIKLKELKQWLSTLVQMLETESGCNIQIGISRVCIGIAEYQRGNTEATEALQIGLGLQKQTVLSFDDLRGLRYLKQFTRPTWPVDCYQELVLKLVQYDDLKQGSELLNTLEVFIENGGNLTDTSQTLKIHRNTLIQRLNHIQTLYHVSDEDANNPNIRASSNWFPLMGAIKTYRLSNSTPKNKGL
jgi:sugar diacid utilization regulator/putative methionine-R-sulfoxide reductase with GAF domain